MAIGVHGADGGYAPHAVGEVRYCVGGGAWPAAGNVGRRPSQERLLRSRLAWKDLHYGFSVQKTLSLCAVVG